LSSSKKNVKFKEISKRIFDKYIDYDDKKVLKIIRKILIIYSRNHKKLLLRILFKWKKNINEILNNNNKNIKQIKNITSFSILKQIPLKRRLMYQNIIPPFTPKENETILLNSKRAKSAKNVLTQKQNIRKIPIISKKEQENLFNSLYNDSQIRKEKLRKMSKEKEDNFNSIYTFTPNIIPNKLNEKYLKQLNESSNKNNIIIRKKNNSFIERLNNYEILKNKNLKKIKEEIEDTIPHPKKIKLNPKDIRLISNSKQLLTEKMKKLEKLKENILIEKGITFKPKLNENINSKIQSDIIERNENFLKEKEIKLHSINEDLECTFSPKINENSTINQSTIFSDVGERLYDYKNKYERNLEEIKSRYLENYSFKPEISKNTNEILENRQKTMDIIKSNFSSINNEKESIKNNNYENENLLLNTSNEKRLEELEESVKRIKELSDENIISMRPYSNYDLNNLAESNINKEKKNDFNNQNKIVNNNSNELYENNTEKKIFESQNNFISVDDNLDKLQIKYKQLSNGRNNYDDIVLFNKKCIQNGMYNEEKDKLTYYTSTNSKTKSIVNFNYYDNLV
jgi:hypothetical protein